MTPAPTTRPRAWTRADLERDRSWIRPLSAAAIDGIEAALAHAKRRARPMLEMDPDDFPLAGAALDEWRAAIASTQVDHGLCLVRGLPVARWSVDDAMLVFWGLGLHTGVARTQGRDSQVLSHVRDDGGEYRVTGGRGYNTNAELDFHCDFCDLVGLLCLHPAERGGESLITSSIALRDEIGRRRPDLLPLLEQPFHYSYQGAQAPGDARWFTCPIFGERDGWFACRHNLKNVVAAHRDFAEIPPLTTAQHEALELFEAVVRDERLCYATTLAAGDVQLLNNHVTMHSRTAFEDGPDPARRRHLLRFWLALPQGQPLPEGWRPGYKSVSAGSVRGGLRGGAVGPAFLDYERRLAAHHGMRLEQQAV